MDLTPIFVPYSAYDPRTALNVVGILEQAGYNTAARDLMKDFDVIFKAPMTWRWYPDLGSHTCSFVAWDEDNVVMLFSGVSDAAHVNQLLASWNEPIQGIYRSGIDPCYQDGFDEVLTDVTLPNFLGRQRYMIAGHSYGAGVAEAAAKVAQVANPEAHVKLWTFGAPRTGTQAWADRMQGLTYARWFLDEDPVRFLPPYRAEAPWMYVIRQGPLADNWGLHTHPATGFQITGAGEVTQTEGAMGALQALTPNLIALVAGDGFLGNPRHTILAYRRAFQAWAARNVPPPAPQPAVPMPPPAPPTPRQRSQNIMQGLSELQRVQLRPAEVITQATAIQAQPTTPPRTRYRRRRMFGMWCVTFNGEILASGLTKRSAGRLARTWNRTILSP